MLYRMIALLAAVSAFAQDAVVKETPPSETVHAGPPNIKQLMLDLIHPSSNEILLLVNRGGPTDEKEWAAARRSAITLAESATLLTQRGRAPNTNDGASDWIQDAKLLADAGSAAYKAALAKDAKALAAAAESLDGSCTACHKQYRPDVFPHQGGSK
jgi:cytochrome c556